MLAIIMLIVMAIGVECLLVQIVHAFCCSRVTRLHKCFVHRWRAEERIACARAGQEARISSCLASPASRALMFHHREWQKEQHKLKVCCLKVSHRRARPVRPCRVLHPCLRTCANQPRPCHFTCAQPSSKRAGHKRRLLSKLQKSLTRVPHSRGCNRSDNVFDCTCGYGRGASKVQRVAAAFGSQPLVSPKYLLVQLC